MPSPFLGMNPYLERPHKWRGIHNRFIGYVEEVLSPQVFGRYFVHTEETIYLREMPGEPLVPLGVPDLAVAKQGRVGHSPKSAAVLDAPDEFELLDAAEEEVSQLYLEVLDRTSREVVTVIELLNPANKATGPDREQYLRKRRRTWASPAHLVEIDLLRGGPRLPLGRPPRKCDYYALVSRAERRPRVQFWPVKLRERLPTIPIPLKTGDADATLDLQTVLHRLYDASTLAAEIYETPPEPRLSAKDAAWAAKLAAGARPRR